MKHVRLYSKPLSLALAVSLALGASVSYAVDILDTAETIFYQPGDQSRMGIEVELTGLSPERVAQEVQSKLGGRIEKDFDLTKTNIKGHDAQGLPIYDTIKTPIFVLKGSSIGDVILKPDYNQITDAFDAEEAKKSVVTEIVTNPIRMGEVEKLQETLTHLKSKGGIGTTPDVAVATQVNVEWMGGKGNEAKWKAADLVNLLRSYTRPEHRAQIDPHLQVPGNRSPYLELFSKGFMKKLLDPSYNPNFREFYDDYIYRQSLERLGVKSAWSMPIEKAREQLISMGDSAIVPQVVKQNPIRISSLLMHLFPNDHMSKLYDASGWAKARPLIEFREWNNDFTCVPQAKQALGLVEGAKRYGYYDHDKLLASISTMDEKAIQDVRKSVNETGRNGKSVFRYYLGDPKTVDRSDYKQQSSYYRVGEVGFLPFGTYGQAPVKIPGESVVFHRRPMHRFSVEGKYNPGLINHNIAQAMENKYVEALFWQKYAPGTMPETRNLKSFKEVRRPERLVERLKREYPNGWVLKGAWDLGSEKDIITDKTDIVGELKKYDPVAFEKRRQALIKKYQGYSDVAPEYLQSELKKDPGYKGWRISQLLEKPDLVMVQKKVPIQREFRVEVVAGKVLGNGSTVDRFKYMYEIGADGLKMKDYQAPSSEDFKKVEAFAQQAIDKLPPQLRGMPYGMDIAILEDGKVAMIESNPGGNSNFLFEEDKASVEALGKFLEKYPDAAKSGEIPKAVADGMDPKAQMEYLKKFFSEHGIDPARQYPGIRFLADRLDDPEFKPTRVSPEDYSVVGKKRRLAVVETPQPRSRVASSAMDSVRLALRRDQVQNASDRLSVAEVRQMVDSRVQALSKGRSQREFRLSSVQLRFNDQLPEHLEAQLALSPEKEAVLSFRPDAEGKVSREAVDEELRHLEQVRKNPERILSRAGSDPLLTEALESHVKKARGLEASSTPHVSGAGKAAVGTGLAQSLMSVMMNQDLKERGAQDRVGYHWVQGVGDADSVANLVIKRPLQSASLRMARGALGLGANGLGLYGAGMSAVDLSQALKEGDAARALSSGTKTGVLGGSVARSLGRPLTERVLSTGAKVAARKAALAGAGEVLGVMTGPVGLTALAVGDMAAMGIEWRTEAYYGSIEKIYSQAQFEDLRLGPGFKRPVMTPSGILGSLKSIETNVDSDESSRQSRFINEALSLGRGLAMREVLGLSIDPVGSEDPAVLARLFAGSAAFNPLATNVPPMIKELCRKKELKCTRRESREAGHFGDSVQYEVETADYSMAMADFVLKEKAKYKAKFTKELQEALASGAADQDWIAFHQEKEKIEKEYTPKLQAEAKKLGNPKSADSSQELTPVQKEFRAKLAAAYSRTMRAAQVTESILEHSGIQRHVTPTEKRALREEVKGYFQKSGASQQSESGKALEGHLAQLESQVLSRKTGQSVEQIQREPLEARLAMRKKDFNEGLAAEGVDAEKLPATVRGAIDEVLRKKLTLESRFGLVSERDPETVREIERTDMQLEALLYGIQMGAKHSPITHAAVEEHARRFLGERPEEKLTEVIQALRPGEVKDRREYDSRNAGRAPARSVTPNNGNPARSSSSSAR